MRATIKKIHPLKLSRNRNSFIRVEFQLEDGEWAKTDLCPDFRNFSRWKDILRKGVGTAIGGVNLKKKGEVNADSFPFIKTDPIPQAERPKPPVKQQTIFGGADYPPPEREKENYEGELSKCCSAPMLEGSGQCMACGAPPSLQ